MATQIESQVIGTAVVVYGHVKVESADGVIRNIQPNSLINLDDRVDTGHDGSVSFVFGGDSSQLDLGPMTNMVIDQDVFGGRETLELSDAVIEPDILQNLLVGWDAFEPVVPLETMMQSEADAVDAGDMVDFDTQIEVSAAIQTGKAAADLASSQASEGDVGSIDDDLDLSNLIPLPDDAA